MRALKGKLQTLLHRFGYQIKKIDSFDLSMDSLFKEACAKVSGKHLQSVERLYALYQALIYVKEKNMGGDIVECGVFKGGSIQFAAYVYLKLGYLNKTFYLYDTFEGWPKQGHFDNPVTDKPQIVNASGQAPWGQDSVPGLDEVRESIASIGYPVDKFIFIKGKVEDTIPRQMPGKICILRLDTDGYESTYHELKHLYPRLVPGGVLIVDDYGHWAGVKKAVDQYFQEQKISIFLHRVDYTGRVWIKNE